MKKKYIVLGFILLVSISCCFNVKAQIFGSKIGAFDAFSNIGSPKIAGTASYNEPSQTYSVTGSGENIWKGEDNFSFLWKKMNDDFIVQTQIRFIGEGHMLHRKTGIMFRSSTSKGSPMVACTLHGDGLLALQYRKTEGADVEQIKFSLSGSDVFQLEKKGNTYTMSVAQFGEVYQSERIENLDLGSELMAGLFVCSHTDEFLEKVEFSNTRIFNSVPDNLVQYKEYLGSLLEVMDVETGHREILGSDKGSWQAPNWTPDGKTLIYNAVGLLYNFDIASAKSSVLNTDFVNMNNNDHVLSFDGKQIGISSKASDANGQSVIYTLPVEGGTPKQLTDKGPSYLHGWSPDNEYLVYTAERGDNNYDIYRISKYGGDEIRLTDAKGLDDGSEYSPDGKYIYFCSTRTGTMQIWRMDANGKNQTQLTFDELNNWFPHVSPDNKWLVFTSFPKEVAADKHPFYERVYIRRMPVDGGNPT